VYVRPVIDPSPTRPTTRWRRPPFVPNDGGDGGFADAAGSTVCEGGPPEPAASVSRLVAELVGVERPGEPGLDAIRHAGQAKLSAWRTMSQLSVPPHCLALARPCVV